jgi:hypothetical protein
MATQLFLHSFPRPKTNRHYASDIQCEFTFLINCCSWYSFTFCKYSAVCAQGAGIPAIRLFAHKVPSYPQFSCLRTRCRHTHNSAVYAQGAGIPAIQMFAQKVPAYPQFSCLRTRCRHTRNSAVCAQGTGLPAIQLFAHKVPAYPKFSCLRTRCRHTRKQAFSHFCLLSAKFKTYEPIF